MSSHLSPWVAFSSLLGLVALVVTHITLTRFARANNHLAEFLKALSVGLVVTVVLAWRGLGLMQEGSVAVQVGMTLSAFLSYLGLGYGYFTFVNLNTTSLRVRLCREIVEHPQEAITIESIYQEYQPAEITRIRVERLLAWNQIQRTEKRQIVVRKGFFLLLTSAIRLAKRVILPRGHRENCGKPAFTIGSPQNDSTDS